MLLPADWPGCFSVRLRIRGAVGVRGNTERASKTHLDGRVKVDGERDSCESADAEGRISKKTGNQEDRGRPFVGVRRQDGVEKGTQELKCPWAA